MKPCRDLITAAACAASIFLLACNSRSESPQVYLRLAGVADGPASMEAAARMTERYIAEKRFLRVVFPDIDNPSEEQIATALSTAVVQPAFQENNPTGPAYVRCTIHTSNPNTFDAMTARCQEQLQEIASLVGVTLVPDVQRAL